MTDGSNSPHSSTAPPPAPAARTPRFRYDDAPVRAAATVAAGPAGGAAPAQGASGLVEAWGGRGLVAFGAGFLLLFVLLFRINLLMLISTWYHKVSWSHGFLIIPLSLVIVALHWSTLRGLAVRGTAVGLPILVYGVASHVLFRVTGQSHMSNLSMLVVLFGTVLLALGWDFLKVLWLPISYLGFMIYLPDSLYVKVTTPMQNLAAWIGTLALPLFGVTAERDGIVIRVMTAGRWAKLGVDEACSGIRMLMAFLALAVILAYTSYRPMWQKVFLAACAVPVAILCNAVRVTLTGAIYVHIGPDYAQGTLHEALGFLMLIPAMGLQLGLAWLLDKIFVETDEPERAGGGA